MTDTVYMRQLLVLLNRQQTHSSSCKDEIHPPAKQKLLFGLEVRGMPPILGDGEEAKVDFANRISRRSRGICECSSQARYNLVKEWIRVRLERVRITGFGGRRSGCQGCGGHGADIAVAIVG